MRFNGTFILDISGSGALLEFFDTRDIPNEFSLRFGGQGAVKRVCHVVWRSHDRLGVKFVGQPKRLPTAPTGSSTGKAESRFRLISVAQEISGKAPSSARTIVEINKIDCECFLCSLDERRT
jgi:hypothetical protein